MRLKLAFLAASVAAYIVLDHASRWWERAYATYSYSTISPDGCIRVDTYNAFRILPSFLHRIPSHDPSFQYSLGRSWETVMFERAHEVSSGRQIGESIVYDGVIGSGTRYWGDPSQVGRRIVTNAGFGLVDSAACSDEVTLAKLRKAYERDALFQTIVTIPDSPASPK